jgi:hypothetical protein
MQEEFWAKTLEYYGFITSRTGIYNFEGVESLKLDEYSQEIWRNEAAHCEQKRAEVSFKIPWGYFYNYMN